MLESKRGTSLSIEALTIDSEALYRLESVERGSEGVERGSEGVRTQKGLRRDQGGLETASMVIRSGTEEGLSGDGEDLTEV